MVEAADYNEMEKAYISCEGMGAARANAPVLNKALLHGDFNRR